MLGAAPPRGSIAETKVGQPAHLARLSADYFSMPENEIVHSGAMLTLLGGQIV